MLKCTIGLACAFMLSACGDGGSETSVSGVNPAVGLFCEPAIEYCGLIPVSANACTDDQFWPFEIDSGQRPFTVHYSRIAFGQRAADTVGHLETAWARQIDDLGFTAPLDDAGLCGNDGRYDVFIWPGLNEAFVDAIAENLQTAHDDYTTYMAINAGGPIDSGLLDTTVAHEFNHSAQASDDWWESALFFEMSATFVEALVYPNDDDYYFTLEDFQNRPEWSLFYDDNYVTWYMYGAAMYLHFLSERYFSGDPAFIARVWRMSRSDPATGRPDYIDALRAVLLNDRGVDLDDSIIEFMQWRWFVATFDDGAHFLHGADWPTPVSFLDADAAMPQISIDMSAMIYGAQYLRISNNTAQPRTFSVDLQQNDADVDWRLTAVNGADVINNITVAPQSDEVIVATVIPLATTSAATLTFDTRAATLTLDEM